ncbi:MAG: SDR family oxidoreductase [Calditrichia bacterium]
MEQQTENTNLTILLTGATGYIGRRLLDVLLREGHRVICLVRDASRISVTKQQSGQITALEGDLTDKNSLHPYQGKIDAAYYLVHSMRDTRDGLLEMEQQSALNFLYFLEKSQCRQIIYLGGMTGDAKKSPHLKSRQMVEETLRSGNIPVTALHAGVIIGSGSASFEIIRDLVEKLPVMIAPKWLNVRHQPIAIRDVLFYLTVVLNKPSAFHKQFEIGGSDILTYREMLQIYARVRGLRRYIITVPVLTPRLSSYWLYFITSTSFPLAQSLVDSMKHEVIVKNDEIQELFPHQFLSYREALERALMRIAEGEIVSSWKDSAGRHIANRFELASALNADHGVYIDHQTVSFTGDADRIKERVWRIGGTNGWYYADFLWKIRGFLDKLSGGVGLRRGRRHPTDLRVGDALDFWRVVYVDRESGHLTLFAEMKLPGEAWLEFYIEPLSDRGIFHQKAIFQPKGLWGRMYWYMMLPFHYFIFKRMAKNICSTE